MTNPLKYKLGEAVVINGVAVGASTVKIVENLPELKNYKPNKDNVALTCKVDQIMIDVQLILNKHLAHG